MDKPIPTPHALQPLLIGRWSRRSFSNRPVELEKLVRLLEAARWAPSSSNSQPWRFIVATQAQPDEYQKMLGILAESNITWAQQAPVLVLSVARRDFESNGKENVHAWHDVGQAEAHLTVQALEEGLAVHQMAGFFPDKAREVYGIPDGYDPVAALAIGYPGDPEALPEKYRERDAAPRTRKPLSEIVFSGRWGEAAPITEGQ